MIKNVHWMLFIALIITISGCVANQNNDNTVIQIDSKDKNSGTVYSTLLLTVPSGAFPASTNVQATGMPATKYDKFIGGWYILSPQDAILEKPAAVSITYSDDAVSLYRSANPDFAEDNLTLAYFDAESLKYVEIESVFDKEKRTVTGEISKFYKNGIMIVEKA